MTTQATLKELVLGAVEGFLAMDTPFSVYDVTQSIRQVVNSGVVEIPNLFVQNQAFKFDISHEDVRFYFSELTEQDIFSRPLNRTFNGQFFVYTGGQVSTKQDPTSTARIQAVQQLQNMGKVMQSIRTPINVVPPSQPKCRVRFSPGKLSRSEVINRVRTYFKNCKADSRTPSAKQIQSAIKRGGKSTGWSRSELSSIWGGIASGTI